MLLLIQKHRSLLSKHTAVLKLLQKIISDVLYLHTVLKITKVGKTVVLIDCGRKKQEFAIELY